MDLDPLAELPRLPGHTDEGEPLTWVLLATTTLDATRWALVVDEQELGSPASEMDVALLELHLTAKGEELRVSEDEAAEATAWDWFERHMNLESIGG